MLPGLRSTRLLAKEICGESAWNFWANPIWKRSRWTSLRKVPWMLIKLDDGMSFNDFDIFWYMFYRCAHIYIYTIYACHGQASWIRWSHIWGWLFNPFSQKAKHFDMGMSENAGDRWVGHPPLVDLSLKVSQNLTTIYQSNLV